MYEEFFGLQTRPFSTVPDPEFMFWAENHRLAYTVFRYALMNRSPITVVTGEIGSGKTTLLRMLMNEIPVDIDVALISNFKAGRGELLQWVLASLGAPCDDVSYVEQFTRFQQTLIDAYACGRRVVLIFDEAQNLSAETLEELRMLSNINADKDELMQIVLVGQPELRDVLSLPQLRQFTQRVSADFHLEALEAGDVVRYVDHRLAVAGAQWRIFPPKTCVLIREATGGVPRLINILCDILLVYSFAAGEKVVREETLFEFLDGARKRGIYRQFRQVGADAGMMDKPC